MKKYLFSLACLLAVTSIQAQTFVTQTDGYLQRVYNSKAIEFVVDHDSKYSTEESASVDIYDKDFKKKKSFQCDGLKDEYISRIEQTWARGSKLVISSNINSSVFAKTADYPDINSLYYAVYDYYGAKESYYYYHISIVEDTIYGIFNDHDNYYDVYTYDYKYPYNVDKFYKKYDAEEGANVWILEKIKYNYSLEYKGEWEMLTSDTTYYGYNFETPEDGLLDVNTNFRNYAYITADMLDNDASTYEYMAPIYGLGEFEEEKYDSEDRDGDGETDIKRMVARAVILSYDVYSDGKKVFSLDFDKPTGSYLPYIYIVDGVPYFIFDKNIFRYDKNTTSLQNVVERTPFSIRKKSECVEVDLGRECEKQCEIVVTSVEGKTYMRQTVSAGTKNVNINTNRLASGIYNFSIIEEGKVVDNGKIIIR